MFTHQFVCIKQFSLIYWPKKFFTFR